MRRRIVGIAAVFVVAASAERGQNRVADDPSVQFLNPDRALQP